MSQRNKIKKWIRRYKTPYLFIAPFFLLFIIFQLMPMVESVFYSFTDFDGLNEPDFIGLDNYKSLFNTKNYAFYDVLINTVIYLDCL